MSLAGPIASPGGGSHMGTPSPMTTRTLPLMSTFVTIMCFGLLLPEVAGNATATVQNALKPLDDAFRFAASFAFPDATMVQAAGAVRALLNRTSSNSSATAKRRPILLIPPYLGTRLRAERLHAKTVRCHGTSPGPLSGTYAIPCHSYRGPLYACHIYAVTASIHACAYEPVFCEQIVERLDMGFPFS